MPPPTNCRCPWTRTRGRGWHRLDHTTGCPVHGADNQDPSTEGTTTAYLVFDAPRRAGMTVQDLYDISAAMIEAHANPAAVLKVRIGWRNNLVEIHAPRM